MMAVDLLRFIVPPGVFFRRLSSCRHACRARASTPHIAQHSAMRSLVQASCLGRAQPMAVAAFLGARAASSAAPPGRRRPERQRKAKAEGKIKGRGTLPLENLVCTWGERSTRQDASACRESAQCCIRIGDVVCFARRIAPVLDGATP
ncbi:hypothetical protein [Burkholderia pseudomallei]|uniref:hypothetical protein n=1 Tax=Burkholderia pseudomallei TaxID=28450 RepID=UPI000A1C9FED|nr:hypothetical protein [Burkholderia pseudomallei]